MHNPNYKTTCLFLDAYLQLPLLFPHMRFKHSATPSLMLLFQLFFFWQFLQLFCILFHVFILYTSFSLSFQKLIWATIICLCNLRWCLTRSELKKLLVLQFFEKTGRVIRFTPGQMHGRSNYWLESVPPPVHSSTGPTGRSEPGFKTMIIIVTTTTFILPI